jgi:putative Mg2+ transporter-C (MgtC) family protein
MTWDVQLQSIALVTLAGLLGGLIGLEREFARRPAGLRTHIFVASASALLMLLGETILRSFDQRGHDNIVSADPIRIIHAVAIGVSFLGAGTIYHPGGSRVEGLTTAGSILFTSGIGLAVAMHQFVLAVGLTTLAIVVLLVVGRVEAIFTPDQKPPGERTSSAEPPGT